MVNLNDKPICQLLTSAATQSDWKTGIIVVAKCQDHWWLKTSAISIQTIKLLPWNCTSLTFKA
jgi:hypothetical protein